MYIYGAPASPALLSSSAGRTTLSSRQSGWIIVTITDVPSKLSEMVTNLSAVSLLRPAEAHFLIKWYNYEQPHTSPDYDNLKTRWEAFQRKMPPVGSIVGDGQTKGVYDVK